MNKGLLGCITFVLGAVTGVGASYLYFKDKINKEIDNEVQKFKNDWYDEKVSEAKEEKYTLKPPTVSVPPEEASDINKNKPPVSDYTKMYVTRAGEEMTIEEYMDKSGLIVDIPKNHPHVISEMEFEDDLEYEKHHYILFADGILADEEGEMVDYDEGNNNGFDYDVIYGFRIQNVTDALYYRVEELEDDYEILKSARFYNEG